MGRSSIPRIPLPDCAVDLPDPLVPVGALGATFDLRQLFGRSGPIECEVGFGKGRLLLDLATSHPETLFLGIERSLPYARLVRYHVLARGIGNVRLLAVDAADLFHRLLPPSSLTAISILFPDPWPKRRHNKRRLVQPSFVADLDRVLIPGGFLNIATDHPGYWNHILATVHGISTLQRVAEFRLGTERLRETHFGARFTARNATIHAATWCRSE